MLLRHLTGLIRQRGAKWLLLKSRCINWGTDCANVWLDRQLLEVNRFLILF